MNLSLRFDIDSAKEEDESSEGEECRCHYLRVKIFHVVSFSSAKLQQKREPTKKVSSRDRVKSILLHCVVLKSPPIVNWEPISFPRAGVEIACADIVLDLLIGPSSVENFELRQHLRMAPVGVSPDEEL